MKIYLVCVHHICFMRFWRKCSDIWLWFMLPYIVGEWIMKAVLATTNITEDQIYREFLRLEMEQLIVQDLLKRYYHN